MRTLTVLGLVVGQLLWLGCGGDSVGGGRETAGGGDIGGEASELSQAEIDSLRFMREEEKLARDVYMVLDHYGNPFANIQNSEQSHMDSVLLLLQTYGIDDPAAGKAVGEFTNPALQTLHDALVAKGLPGEIAALRVGCEIEELDIRDIEIAKADIDQADILTTYDRLLKGSRNHLRAYYGRLTGVNGTYTPQYITQAEFDAIVSSPKE